MPEFYDNESERNEIRRAALVGVYDGQCVTEEDCVKSLYELERTRATMRAFELAQLTLKRRYTRSHATSVAFKLSLTGTARAYRIAAYGALTRQFGAVTDEPRSRISELSQLDLKLALARHRVAGEYIEYEHRAVDDVDVVGQTVLNIFYLRRRQLVIEYDEVDIVRLAEPREFL